MNLSHLGGLLLAALPILLWAKYFLPRPNRPHTAPGTPQPESKPVPEKNKLTCIRISGIPLLWDSERLEKALETIDPNFDPMGAKVSGPFPDSYDSSTQTALLNLSECTLYFTFEPNQEKHEVINENGQEVHLVFDKHFYDLTPLNQAEEPIKMEFVNPLKGAFQMLTCVPTA